MTEPQQTEGRKPSVIITIGMAGSGKTTFVQRINSYLHAAKKPPYIVNLDPAVSHLPFEANIDIRDTVDYAQVMKQYKLGPNGGILTALNLFTTKFEQVLSLLEKRSSTVENIILDTPGQIEIFTWSASGAIITDAVASSFPTVVAYIIDTPRTAAPATFMSNMLYACSILYKTRLPFVLVFNKTDVQSHDFALEWMEDFEAFQAALAERERDADGEQTFMSSLMNSMSLVLDEFYKGLKAVGVSAVTGAGISDFFKAVEEARKEYEEDYVPEMKRMMAEREKTLETFKKESLNAAMKDLSVDSARPWSGPGPDPRTDKFAEDEAEEEENIDADDGEETYLDPDETGRQYIDLTRPRRTADNDFKWPRPT
ncbi:GPN-loop GTPase 1 {ECO:0000250/UniProtKB:P47122} {ECO:0000250/UniProtKB:P47122} [Serendipita indica DSM 11827]|nr:GPN-loop GTPase 1 {ECO:0000250/UniProtKB:P47122} {ECO:0000250/UniProtKB:P47122} [Serendipita indica DSM 11827]